MSRKPSRGIRRAGSGVSVTGKAPTKNDIVYVSKRETDEEFRKSTAHSRRWLKEYRNDEGIKAIEALPDGARFSVERSGFGSGYSAMHYVVNRSESGERRSISRIRENGSVERGKTAKTRTQIKKIVNMLTAESITIHNQGKTYNRPISKRAERELFKSMQREYEKQKAKEGKTS